MYELEDMFPEFFAPRTSAVVKMYQVRKQMVSWLQWLFQKCAGLMSVRASHVWHAGMLCTSMHCSFLVRVLAALCVESYHIRADS